MENNKDLPLIGERIRYLPISPTSKRYWNKIATIKGYGPYGGVYLDFDDSTLNFAATDDVAGRIERLGIPELLCPDTRDYLSAIASIESELGSAEE